MARIIQFEGRQISLPDDASDDEVAQALGGTPAAAAPQAPAVDIPGIEPQFSPEAPRNTTPGAYPYQSSVQGAGSGLAHLVGALPDLASGAVNIPIMVADKASRAVGGPDLPFRFPSTSEAIKNTAGEVAETVGIPVADYSKADFKTALPYNVADFGTQAVGTVPALVRAASRRAAEIIAGSAPKWYDDLVRPYMGEGSVARPIAGDALATTGTATAKTAVDQTEYKDNPIVQTFAALGGGVGGSTVASASEAAARRTARAVKRPFGGDTDKTIPVDPESLSPVAKTVSDAAAAKIQGAAAYDPAESAARMQANRTDLQALDPDAPIPSPAALAEDPGLANLERNVRRLDPGKAMASDREFASGVRDTIDRIAPAGADPAALVRRVQGEADTRVAGAQRLVDRAAGREARVADIREGDAGEVTPYAGRGVPASQRLDRTIVDEGYIPARDEKNRLYNEGVPADTPVDLSGAATAAGGVRQRVDQLPESFRAGAMNPAQLTDMEAAGPTTYGAARETRMALSEERNRARAAGDFTRADNIGEVRRPIDAEMNRVNPDAERNYRDNFAPTYRPGPGDEAAEFTRAIDRDPTRSKTPPSQTADRFIQPQAPEQHAALQRMINASADPAAGRAAAREYLLSDLEASGAVRDGALNPAKLEAWQRKWGDLETVAPGIGAEIAQLTDRAQRGARVAGVAEERRQAAERGVTRTRAEIDNGPLGAVRDADQDKAVFAVMSKPDRSGRALQELIDVTAPDPAARNGLKAAVRDFLVDKATTNASEKLRPGDRRGPVSQNKLATIFGEHEQQLANLHSPEEMNTLRAGHRALELANIERLRTGTGSDTVEKTVSMVDQFLGTGIGKGVEAALRVKYGLLKAGGLISTVRRSMSGVTGGVDPAEVSRLVERAAYDPELMGLLLGRKLPVGSPAWNSKLNRLMAYGEGARHTDNDD